MRNRTSLALGILLIGLGAWFLLVRQVPDLQALSEAYLTYPMNIIAAGALIFVVGLLVGAPGLSVPAAIVTPLPTVTGATRFVLLPMKAPSRDKRHSPANQGASSVFLISA